MLNPNELKFDANGLIPAIVVDAQSQSVLTLAYMNRESLAISLAEGRTCFWSRSRKELWRKGETSGNVQHIVNMKADCDRDALVVYVKKDGPPATSARIPALTTMYSGTNRFPSRRCTRFLKAARQKKRKVPTPPIFLKKASTKF